ncbi:RHS repeat domain-containing protein [Pseudomonas sp. MYb118]|uniref:RHS repeat domain-containing protein n=1 Tax=Pseudomonas sp. MYb118 TaxID=1848720 RepID=UPI0034CE1972
MQASTYQYDAVGNVLSIEDTAQPIRYFNNQRIEPIKTFRYDTLGQLIEATGGEAVVGSSGPALPDLLPLMPDPSQIANYTQTFHYDGAGNLAKLVHVGAQAQGRTLTRLRYSNRCLPDRDGRPPTEAELASGFDANGNLLELQPGQRLNWDMRNQLCEVCPATCEDTEESGERYIYDGAGRRVRKVLSSRTNARTISGEVRYLPGLELRSHGGTGEVLQVITVNTGSNNVQVLHWVSSPPDEMVQDQVRYSLTDPVRSCTVELNQQANVITREWFYPFGATALWAGRNAVEAKYKFVRYSGKERDATGLIHYGFRYYAPWIQRWINTDPSGYADGMNLYQFAGNDPINNIDIAGLKNERWRGLVHKYVYKPPHIGQSNGLRAEYVDEHILDISRQVSGSMKYMGVLYYSQQQRIEKSTHSIETVSMTLPDKTKIPVNGVVVTPGGIDAHYFNNTATTDVTVSSNWLSDEGRVGYVLGMNENKQPELAIYSPQLNVVHHSSPFAGRPVLDSGMMSISNGGVAFIENSSGHYQPLIEQKLHTLNFLRKNGINLEDTFLSEFIPPEIRFSDAQNAQDELENFFKSNLYNAEDFYAFHLDKSVQKAPGERPVIVIPAAGKEHLSPMETATYRDWSVRSSKTYRPQKFQASVLRYTTRR